MKGAAEPLVCPGQPGGGRACTQPREAAALGRPASLPEAPSCPGWQGGLQGQTLPIHSTLGGLAFLAFLLPALLGWAACVGSHGALRSGARLGRHGGQRAAQDHAQAPRPRHCGDPCQPNSRTENMVSGWGYGPTPSSPSPPHTAVPVQPAPRRPSEAPPTSLRPSRCSQSRAPLMLGPGWAACPKREQAARGLWDEGSVKVGVPRPKGAVPKSSSCWLLPPTVGNPPPLPQPSLYTPIPKAIWAQTLHRTTQTLGSAPVLVGRGGHRPSAHTPSTQGRRARGAGPSCHGETLHLLFARVWGGWRAGLGSLAAPPGAARAQGSSATQSQPAPHPLGTVVGAGSSLPSLREQCCRLRGDSGFC